MTLPGGMPPIDRDLAGYGEHLPDPQWPSGARLALSFVVNVEEGAELAVSSGDERNESVHETDRAPVEGADPCMESHFAYGARAGLWRVLRAFDRFGMKATFSCSGRAVAHTPVLAQAPHARGHEISAHGWRWESHAGMSEATEQIVIAQTVAALTKACGERPLGWHTKSVSTPNTRRLLVEEGGFLYDSDAYDDDLPRRVMIAGASHIILPYCFDTNDMRFAPGVAFVQPEDFSRYCISAIDQLLEEGGRMLSIGLHLRVIGRPARIAGLLQVMQHVAGNADRIWVARRVDIARHWAARFPA